MELAGTPQPAAPVALPVFSAQSQITGKQWKLCSGTHNRVSCGKVSSWRAVKESGLNLCVIGATESTKRLVKDTHICNNPCIDRRSSGNLYTQPCLIESDNWKSPLNNRVTNCQSKFKKCSPKRTKMSQDFNRL